MPIRNALQILKMADNNAAVAKEMARDDGMPGAADGSPGGRSLRRLRITRGTFELRLERVDLAAVAATAVETGRPAIEAAKHHLTVTRPAGPVYVDGDRTRLSQVLANLLNNSAKYTPEGGQIGLTVATEDGQAIVRIRDNGLGIPPEMLSRVFEMFTQVNRAVDSAQGGLGIGLTLRGT